SIIIHNTRTTPFSTLSLHDALPILWRDEFEKKKVKLPTTFEEAKQAAHALNRPKENFYGLGQSWNRTADGYGVMQSLMYSYGARSEEHTSELQSLTNIVCRLLTDQN